MRDICSKLKLANVENPLPGGFSGEVPAEPCKI